jgi:hypothetical protein
VPQDYAEAVKWYRKAADQGDANAQANLGAMYFKGEGVPQNDIEVYKWLTLAAAQGNEEARGNLSNIRGLMSQDQIARAQEGEREVYRKAAEQGDALAQLHLGLMYEEGKGGQQDYNEALKWFRKAADQGNAPAQYNLGLIYEKGERIPQNYAEAMNWYRKAAEQGNADSQTKLGFMYGQGKGVPENDIESYKWFTLASAKGNKVARNNMSILQRSMSQEQISKAQEEAKMWSENHKL